MFHHDFFTDKRIVRLYFATKRLHACRYGTADMTKADESDQIAADTVNRPLYGTVFPAAVAADVALIFRQLANQCQNHRARMVCNIIDTIRRIVDNHDAVLIGSFQIHII